MNMYALPTESFPMNTETMQAISKLAKDVKAATGSTLKYKRINKMADSFTITTDDLAGLYDMEKRLMLTNDTAAAAIYAVRMEIAQPFENDFYKDPATGYGYTEEA